MKKILVLVLCFSIYNSALSISSVYAHVLKTDGDIGAVVHIDPEDDPIAGQVTTIYFDIKDKSGLFKEENCTCTFVIKQAGAEIYSELLNGTTVQFMFPERNVYTIELQGAPKVDGQFKPFVLSYDIRVDRSNETVSTKVNDDNIITSHIPHVVVISFVAIICGIVIYSNRTKKHD